MLLLCWSYLRKNIWSYLGHLILAQNIMCSWNLGALSHLFNEVNHIFMMFEVLHALFSVIMIYKQGGKKTKKNFLHQILKKD